MPNFIWPSLRRPRVSAAGAIARVLHWTGVIVAGLCVLLAIELLVEGWGTELCRGLLVTAAGLVFGTRALRYVLARE